MAGRKKKERPLVLSTEPKKRKPHSQETRDKISEKRRARTVQPRNISQSDKRKSFYDELAHEYGKKNNKKISDRKREQLEIARKWIENNKYELGHIDNLNDKKYVLEQYEKDGIVTEYIQMYHKEYELQVGSMLYSDERTPVNNKESDDPYDMVDDLVGDYFGENLEYENDSINLELSNNEEEMSSFIFEDVFYEMEIEDD